MSDKRLELLKLIVNSDEKGIDKIHGVIFNNKLIPFSEEDFHKIVKQVGSEMVADVPGRILIIDDLVEYAVRIQNLSFKEEK